MALDLVRGAYDQRYEVAIIVSQDSDFGPAVRLAKEIAQEQDRMLHFESCYPVAPGSSSQGFQERSGFKSTKRPTMLATIRETIGRRSSDRPVAGWPHRPEPGGDWTGAKRVRQLAAVQQRTMRLKVLSRRTWNSVVCGSSQNRQHIGGPRHSLPNRDM